MANLQASSFFLSNRTSVAIACQKRTNKARSLYSAKTQQLQTQSLGNLSVPNEFIDELKPTHKPKTARSNMKSSDTLKSEVVVKELYAIMDLVADRAEMHKNIGAQRDNWNSLLLTSVNGITVTAATMSGLAAVGAGSGKGGAAILALKLSSALLYAAATGVLVVMNKIQPSQLAEEQRNASRFFKQLHEEMKSNIALIRINKYKGTNSLKDYVKDAMEKVLALDRAYPLPLLGAMLDKFPKNVEPAVWWPEHNKRAVKSRGDDGVKKLDGAKVVNNGWDERLEEEMREIAGVLKNRDTADYVRLGKVALMVSKILSTSGPLLTGLAAVGSAFVGSFPLAAVMGVVFGALATVINTLEHGGQVGMVFEMYRSNAGFFRLIGENIESTLDETEVDQRENGELFEAKVALELGRNLSELRDLASAAAVKDVLAKEEFASKLF